MFNIGATVSIINSTVKKDQTGPRKGSIGYAAAKGRIFFLRFEKSEIEAATDPTSILFTRYGNDSSTRKEFKGFINIVPVLPKWTDNSEKIILDFVENLSISSEEEWSNIKDYMMVNKYSSIGVAVPVLGAPVNLKTCDNNDFVLWFETFLRSHNILSLLNEIGGSKGMQLSNVTDTGMISSIREMANSKNQKASLMSLILADTGHRANISDVLMKLVMTSSSIENKKVLSTFERGLKEGIYSAGDFQQKGEFIQALMYDYYTPMFDKKVRLVQKYGEKRERLLAEALLKTREVMVSLVTVGQVPVPVGGAQKGESS